MMKIRTICKNIISYENTVAYTYSTYISTQQVGLIQFTVVFLKKFIGYVHSHKGRGGKDELRPILENLSKIGIFGHRKENIWKKTKFLFF